VRKKDQLIAVMAAILFVSYRTGGTVSTVKNLNQMNSDNDVQRCHSLTSSNYSVWSENPFLA
jgi:hypothetical protein